MNSYSRVSTVAPSPRAELILPSVEAALSPGNAPDAEIDPASLAWREAFVSRYKGLTAAEVADQSGNTARNRSAIASRWAAEKKIFGIRFRNRTLYPEFQFRHGEPIPVIAKILKEMPDRFTGWDVAFFLTSPNGNLDWKKPLGLLKADPERVASLAHAFSHSADAF